VDRLRRDPGKGLARGRASHDVRPRRHLEAPGPAARRPVPHPSRRFAQSLPGGPREERLLLLLGVPQGRERHRLRRRDGEAPGAGRRAPSPGPLPWCPHHRGAGERAGGHRGATDRFRADRCRGGRFAPGRPGRGGRAGREQPAAHRPSLARPDAPAPREGAGALEGRNVLDAFGVGYCARGTLRGTIAITVRDEDGDVVAYAAPTPQGQPTSASTASTSCRRASAEAPRPLQPRPREARAPREEGLVLVEGFFAVP
jgi:hypothetical protein